MATSVTLGKHSVHHVEIRRVPALQSIIWLRRGWDDLTHLGWASLVHGVLIVVMGWVLLGIANAHLYFVVAAVTGYLLVGPIMTTGLCELSRRRAAREPAGFDDSLEAVARHPTSLAQFGALLAAIAVVWLVASQVMLSTLATGGAPSAEVLLWGSFTGAIDRAQALAYIGSGAVLAAIVFTLSVVTVPLIIDRGMGTVDALTASVRATLKNIPAMLVWSGLIVVLTAIGFATLLAGMIVIAPLLGHATWHAYRDLVR
jgi:uncharacterized membrane protein